MKDREDKGLVQIKILLEVFCHFMLKFVIFGLLGFSLQARQLIWATKLLHRIATQNFSHWLSIKKKYSSQ